MKTITLIILTSSLTLTAYSQFNQVRTRENQSTTEEARSTAVAYRLFPTENMWTFIKLNTRNGLIWQVQFDVQGNNRHETHLNLLTLVNMDKETNDRFTLYPTQNVYTFILLDQIDGRVWQVQWSIDPANRAVIPIN